MMSIIKLSLKKLQFFLLFLFLKTVFKTTRRNDTSTQKKKDPF